MKPYSKKFILYSLFVVSSNVIFAASPQGFMRDLLRAQVAHNKGIDFAALDAISTFKSLYKSSPEDPKISVHKKAVQIFAPNRNAFIVFAAQGKHQAQAAIVYDPYQFIPEDTYGNQPSPLQLLVGLAELPCNISAAENTLDCVYNDFNIQNYYRKPFDGANKDGCWKKNLLPKDIAKSQKSLETYFAGLKR